MLESSIERSIRKWCNAQGWHCLKLETRSVVGFPDRTVLMPEGRVAFLEIKQPGGKRSRAQKVWIERLRLYGYMAAFVESLDDVKELLGCYTNTNEKPSASS